MSWNWRQRVAAPTNFLETIDLREFVASGTDVFASTGVSGDFLTSAWAAASAAGKALLMPAGVILMTGPGAMRPPLAAAHLYGMGIGKSILRSHPTLFGASPLISAPVEGSSAEVQSMMLRDMTFDGDFDNNLAFNTRCTLTATYTPGDTTLTVDAIPAAFPASQAFPAGVQFDDDPEPDVQYLTYTSRSSTQFFGCELRGNTAVPRVQDIGQECFWRDRSGLGLVRIYACERISLQRVEIKNGPGYGFGLEGHPESGDIKTDVYLEELWAHHNGSDGCDIKAMCRWTAINCLFTDNADTGFDPRSQYGMAVGVRAHRNTYGINIASARPILPEIWADLAVTTTKTQTTMILTERAVGDIPDSGSGPIDVEEIDWTGRTDNGNGTITITGVSRGMRGTRPAVHTFNSPYGTPRLVPDLSTLTTPPLSQVKPTATDFEWPTDLIGCQTDDNRAGGTILYGGGQTRFRINLFGGGAKRNGGANLNILGNNQGRSFVTVVGGHYLDGKTDNIRLNRLHHAVLEGVHSSGALGEINGNGDGLVIESCANGVTVNDFQVYGNLGRAVRLLGTTDYCEINGEALGNIGGNTVAEATGYKHNRGNMFGSGRAGQGRIRALLPVSDAGSSASTLPTIWENIDRDDITSNTIAACVSQRLELFSVWLPRGLPITRLGILIGGTGSAAITNSWFALYDEAFALLVQTPDGTNGAQAAADYYSRPITYTVPEDGLYWFGPMVKAGTCPTYAGKPSIATGAVPWKRIITTNTGLTTTAPNPAVPAAAPGGEGVGTPYIFFK